MFEATVAGSLPKPGWLMETGQAVAAMAASGAELATAKRDATLLWLKEQEDAGLDIVSDGEQSRQHFVHGFLESVDGIDFEHKVEMGIRADRYKAMVPQVIGPLKLRGRVHQVEARAGACTHQSPAEDHAARPDDRRRHGRPIATMATARRWPWPSPGC